MRDYQRYIVMLFDDDVAGRRSLLSATNSSVPHPYDTKQAAEEALSLFDDETKEQATSIVVMNINTCTTNSYYLLAEKKWIVT